MFLQDALEWLNRWQSLALKDLIETWNSTGSALAILGGAGLAFGDSAGAFDASGADAQAAQLEVDGVGLSVTVGLVVLQHMPGNDHQLVGCCDFGDVVILPFGVFAKKTLREDRDV